MVKAHTLVSKTREELLAAREAARKELASLRVVQKTAGTPSRVCKIAGTRKDIARILTVFNSNERISAKKALAGKPLNKWPKDLRPKQTRAKRRALPKALVSAVRRLTHCAGSLRAAGGNDDFCYHHLSPDCQ